MDPRILTTLAAAGVSVSVTTVAYLLYRATGLFWNRSAYLDGWGNSPEQAVDNLVAKLKDRAVIE